MGQRWHGRRHRAARRHRAGCQLWISDGTAAGTTRITDSGAVPGGASPGHLVIAEDVVYFAATDANGERELWKLALPPRSELIFRDGFSSPP